MAEAGAELMFEILRSIQARLAQIDGKMDELKQEMQASRIAQNATRQDIIGVHQEISAIHATLVRHEIRLDRIDRRLELSEVPTS
jgi:septal ring factor EnvC (AmiA/AmiB activator)